MARILSSSHGLNRARFTPLDWALFVGIGLIWGSSFFLIEIGLESFSTGMVTWLRVGLGAATLWLFPKARAAVEREDRPRVLMLSIVWVAIPFTLFPIAQQWITSATTGMVNGLTPIFAATITALLLRHRPPALQVVGLVIGFGGGLLIAYPSMGSSGSEIGGVLLILAGTLLYGFSISIATPIQQKYGSMPVFARVLTWATVWTAPFGLIGFDSASFEPVPTAALISLGALNTGIAYAIMGTLIGRVGSTRGSFSLYLIPAVAVVLGVVFLNESVAPIALVGVTMVIAGAVLASRRESRLTTPSTGAAAPADR